MTDASAARFDLPARLTLDEARTVAEALEQAVAAMARGARLTVDGQALSQFDSSALAVLLASQRAAAQREVTLQVQGLPARLQELAGLYGVAEQV
ncbi:MAG: hypothetical protein RL722_677 [Pseudomonadota bacterium]|jgi:phospholipid transport system transporter-binding protein